MRTQFTNDDRMDFLKSLDRSDVEVTDWEARFIESVFHRTQVWFSRKEQSVIDTMIDDYGERIGF